MKFNFNNENLDRVVAKCNEIELTVKTLQQSAAIISRQISSYCLENETIGILVGHPLIYISAILGAHYSNNKICLLNMFDSIEYNKFKIKEANISLIICDSDELLNSLDEKSVKHIVKIDEDIFTPNIEDKYDSNNAIGEFVCGRSLFEAHDFSFNGKMIENWVQFNENILKIELSNVTLIWNRTEPINPYFLLSPLFGNYTLNIIETIDKTANEIIELIKKINCKTYFMSLEMLTNFEFEIMMSDDEDKIFENILTYGNDLYDLCSLKEYCNNKGIKWYNIYGNHYVQFITALKKDLTGQIYHVGKEIIGNKAYVMNNALSHMPIGIPGKIFALNVYDNNLEEPENELLKTEFIAKRMSDGKLIFTGYEDNAFYFNGRLCSAEYIKLKLTSKFQVRDVKIGFNKEKLFVFYSSDNDFSYEHIQSFIESCIPQFYPQIHFVLKSEKELKGNSFEQLIKTNRTLDSIQVLSIKKKLQSIISTKFILNIFIESDKPIFEVFYCSIDGNKMSTRLVDSIESIVYEKMIEYGCHIDTLALYSISNAIYFSDTSNLNSIRCNAKKDVRELKDKEVLTADQKEILNIWKSILNNEEIGLDDNFFDIGGSSLLFVKLVHELSVHMDRNIPMVELMGKATVRTCFKFLEMSGSIEEESFETILRRDTIVDKYIKNIEEAKISTNYKNDNILLTGSTGFIGVFLLKELLIKTNSKIYCLIRAKDINHAYKRLFDTMSNFKLSSYFNKERIIPILGDFGKEMLGITKLEYDELCENIDVIFHNGAAANFIYSYEMLKNENVIGTGRIIEFACTKKIKPINYISSLAIFGVGSENGKITEQSEPNKPSVPRTGYTKTKWVADNMMLNARKKNVPCNIFRVANVCGDSVNGICQTKDFIWILLKLGIDINAIPEYYDVPFNFITVDSIAKSIVGLSVTMKEGYGENYHITGETRVLFTNIFKWIQSYGYKLKMVSFNEWVEMLQEYTEKMETGIFQSVPSVINIKEDVADDFEFISFDSSITQKRLHDIGEKIISLNEDIFHRHLKNYIDIGFMKPVE